MTNNDSIKQYEALTTGCGLVRLSDWTLLELTGADRCKFLHNFCTADINGLEENHATEAFVLNGKGKILGYTHVVSLPDRLLLVGAGSQATTLIEHLDRYIIRDDVKIRDMSNETNFLFLAGQASSDVIESVFGITLAFGRAKAVDDPKFDVVHGEIAGPGFLFLAGNDAAEVETKLSSKSDSTCDANVLETIRLENQTPWFGREVDDSNLPQEIDRDEKAINFNKGCYLGQETVARIDALGRVNRLLRYAKLSGEMPAIGQEIFADDLAVGNVLSAAKKPGTEDSVLGIIVKRSASNAGTEISIGSQTATVI